MLQIKFMSAYSEIALRWIPVNTFYDAVRQQANIWANMWTYKFTQIYFAIWFCYARMN